MAIRSPLGCLAYSLLVILGIWLMLLLTESPGLNYFVRSWFLARDAAMSILQAIWHFLGG
jgi:hypothetical protein